MRPTLLAHWDLRPGPLPWLTQGLLLSKILYS